MTDAKTALMQSWETLQEADMQVLQALSDLSPESDFDPRESISKAISILTKTAISLDRVKANLNH